MAIDQFDAVRRSMQDEVNSTVYGNPILDVIINVHKSARYAHFRNALEHIATIHESGTLEFKPNKYIGFVVPSSPGGSHKR